MSNFDVHKLSNRGIEKAHRIKTAFENLTMELDKVMGDDGRLRSLVMTKLEEASFFAKKSMAKMPENQEKL